MHYESIGTGCSIHFLNLHNHETFLHERVGFLKLTLRNSVLELCQCSWFESWSTNSNVQEIHFIFQLQTQICKNILFFKMLNSDFKAPSLLGGGKSNIDLCWCCAKVSAMPKFWSLLICLHLASCLWSQMVPKNHPWVFPG